MAADSHNGSLKNAVIRERLSDSPQKFNTHKQKVTFVRGVTSKFALLKIPYGGPTAMLEFQKMLLFRNGLTDFH
jgi:hypothetical protein